ncbi:hypothetical protein MVEN_02016700 [Mycena venus]|uniref:Cytochrome P450 n=1 Tax=Mycena venus TaxID=2733690 RepID=A0A8H6XBZ8_9AGAR|nr:hypothetical protein MVEN_02016700 [Mycena venus]
MPLYVPVPGILAGTPRRLKVWPTKDLDPELFRCETFFGRHKIKISYIPTRTCIKTAGRMSAAGLVISRVNQRMRGLRFDQNGFHPNTDMHKACRTDPAFLCLDSILSQQTFHIHFIPRSMDSPLLVWAITLGLINHLLLHKFEPASANIPFLLLAFEPAALLAFVVGGPFSTARLGCSYAVFLGSLGLSIVAYRLSPLHPLAQYPGPAIGKVTKLWGLWKASHGYKYLYHKELHDRYGPYVRTGEQIREDITRTPLTLKGLPSGPNEISVIDAPAVSQILNSGGLEKGRYYEGGRHSAMLPSIVCMSGEAHTAKRRVWNRAMTSAAIREYEPLVVKRASQLVSRLREQNGIVDLVSWLDLFALDLMGNLAFGGGFEMLRDGKDVDGVGERMRGFMKVSNLSGQLPWIINTLHLLPHVGRTIQEFNDFGQNLAIQRMQNGASDEAGLEKEKPTMEMSAADGIIAVIAASDTAASTLSSLVWFLLSNPKYYRRVQQELDNMFVEGDDIFDVNKYQELYFLSACMSVYFCPILCSSVHLYPETRHCVCTPLCPPTVPDKFTSAKPAETLPEAVVRTNLDSSPRGRASTRPRTRCTAAPTTSSRTPDQFIPDRWFPNAKFERHDTAAFIPFSLGPANCIGQKFAKRELFMVLSALFKSFEMRFADGFDAEAWPLGMQDFFVVTRGPLRVTLTPRKNESCV